MECNTLIEYIGRNAGGSGVQVIELKHFTTLSKLYGRYKILSGGAC